MMFSVLLSRVIGLAREQVIANMGGTSTEIDAYVTAFILPELLNHFLAGGFLSITFIPIFQRYLAASDEQGAWRCFSNILSIGTAAFLIVIPVSMLLAPALLGRLGSHISAGPTFALTVRLTRIILPAQMFFFWGAFFSAVQMANQRFFWPAVAPLFYNIGIILGGILLRPYLGVEGFAWGVLAGAFAGNVLFQRIGARRVGMRYTFRFDLKDPDLIKYVALSLPLVLGLTMTFSNEILFRLFGSLLGTGGTSSINYALRTMGFVVAVFGQASGVAFYPYLSRLAIERKFSEITSLLNRAVGRIAVFCIPVSLILIVLAHQVIAVLYQHGRFTAESTARTAPVFALYMAGAFFYSVSVFVVRPFYALQKMYTPVIISTGIFIVSLPMYYFGSRAWGAEGIAASAVAGMVLQFVTLYIVWNTRHGDRKSLMGFVKTISTVIGISAAAAVLGWFVKQELEHITFGFGKLVDNLIICTLTALPAGAMVLLLYQMTGVQRVSALLKRVRKSGDPKE
jgi:putative peptidoglycan lipid II flippase